MRDWMGSPVQDALVFVIVAAVSGYWGFRILRSVAFEPLAGFLLRRGKVKWAMRLRYFDRRSRVRS